MLAEADLRRVVASLPVRAVHGPWFRVVDFAALQSAPPDHSPEGSPQPLWAGGPRRRGARFTPRDSFDTIYLASDPITAILESNRAFLLPGRPLVPLRAVPTVTLTVDGVIADALDLTDVSVQERLGTSLAELTGDWRYTQSSGGVPPTQLLARLAHGSTRIHALLYRSAKNLEQGANLAVFTERFGCGRLCYLEVFDPASHRQDGAAPRIEQPGEAHAVCEMVAQLGVGVGFCFFRRQDLDRQIRRPLQRPDQRPAAKPLVGDEHEVRDGRPLPVAAPQNAAQLRAGDPNRMVLQEGPEDKAQQRLNDAMWQCRHRLPCHLPAIIFAVRLGLPPLQERFQGELCRRGHCPAPCRRGCNRDQ